MKKSIIYSLLVGVISVYATCNKRLDCHTTIYSFEAKYTVRPDSDSIHPGDTIWMELTSSTQMNNLFTNQVVDFSGAENFGTAVGYAKITGGNILDPGVTPAADSFENALIKGTSVPSQQPDQVRSFFFSEENGMYVFKLGIVPKVKGLFMISPGNAVNVYTNKNKCDKANFSLTIKNTNQHLYLYEQSRPGYVLSAYDRGHLYVFKVY
jgi:hypothetical protein